ATPCRARSTSTSDTELTSREEPSMEQGTQLMFSVEEFRTRLEMTRERLRERGVAGMLVHTPDNMHYLSGYHTPGYYACQTILVPADASKPPVLVVRRLEESNVSRSWTWSGWRTGSRLSARAASSSGSRWPAPS